MTSVHRARNERGASLVEAAVVSLIAFTLLFAIFESALVGRAYLAGRYGASAGARAGAVASNDPAADRDTLSAIARAASVTSGSAIEQIVIFKAAGPGDSIPPECLDGPVTGLCNVYSSADFSRAETDFGPGGWAADDYWAASTRQTSRSLGTDYLGVYIAVGTGVTFVPLPHLVTYTAVTRIEDTAN